MSTQKNGKLLQGKDLISIGIFSAIYFVLNFICMLLSGLHPVIWILMPALIALVTGIPFLLMCAKVQKFGAVLLMGMVTGLLYFVTGQFTVILLGTFLAACLLGELIRFLGGYKSFLWNAAAFAAFSLGMTGFPASDLDHAGELFNTDQRTGNGGVLRFHTAGALLTGNAGGNDRGTGDRSVVGAWIANGMFHKHFKKAGMV